MMCLAGRLNIHHVSKKTSACFVMDSFVHKCTFKCKEMMGLIGAGNNPMVGMTVACAVAVSEAK